MKTIRLTRDHWQAGVFYPAGSTVDLPDGDADFVIAQEIARRGQLVAEAEAVLPALAAVMPDAAEPVAVEPDAGEAEDAG
jgi:hypothetical protein